MALQLNVGDHVSGTAGGSQLSAALRRSDRSRAISGDVSTRFESRWGHSLSCAVTPDRAASSSQPRQKPESDPVEPKSPARPLVAQSQPG